MLGHYVVHLKIMLTLDGDYTQIKKNKKIKSGERSHSTSKTIQMK